jgi:DNA-directed RNA polymerase specialized sigma24 family protein
MSCALESRIDIHDNARLTPRGREALVRRVLEASKSMGAAEDFGVSIRTTRKRLDRF